ncbi:P-loop containing nucleoside triphosphate hydrolase protein [Karstenula rhodostoma CBS 690.94]|uniref:P-loop containing nucleoside triphosphate hydrolase protein n=1 Tax=Karstenula rhodostoma CBS 690.94 TaxID=1392251 RepID=A0A9P4PA32_9PLEO|nr:P-loop containing nucleoside triphosphate hydrolase protein [Karstenula rhodostoma CBS 690.94]
MISFVYRADEFIYVLGVCLLNYGSVIGAGMYRSATTGTWKQIAGRREVNHRIDKEGVLSTPSTELPRTSASAPPSTVENQTAAVTRNTSLSVENQLNQSSHAPTPPDKNELREQIRNLRVVFEEDDDSILEMADVAGLDSVKAALDEFACFFLHFPHLTKMPRHRSTTGILLFGPQGTDKTLLVKSFAQKYHLSVYDVRASAIMSKFVGEAEKFVKALFKEVRANTPSVLLLDECDGLLCNPTRDSSQSHYYRLLQNGLKNQWSDLMYSKDEVIIVGVTNKPHDIDMDGFGRRLSLKLHVALPNATGCQAIRKGALGRLRHALNDDEITRLGFLCHECGLPGYDIDCLVEGLLRSSLRKIVLSGYFQRLDWDEGTIVVPCNEDEEGAIKGPYVCLVEQVEDISYRPFTVDEVERAIHRTRPTVDEAMTQKHTMFASQPVEGVGVRGERAGSMGPLTLAFLLHCASSPSRVMLLPAAKSLNAMRSMHQKSHARVLPASPSRSFCCGVANPNFLVAILHNVDTGGPASTHQAHLEGVPKLQKARCTGERPECSFCVRLEQACTYSDEVPYQDSSSSSSDKKRGEATTMGGLDCLENQMADVTQTLRNIAATVQNISRDLPNSNADDSSSIQSEAPNGAVINGTQNFTTLPSKNIIRPTADLYLKFFFERKFEVDEVPIHLLFALLASTVRYSDDPYFEDKSASVSAYASQSWKSIVMPWNGIQSETDLSIVQTIMLLALVDYVDGRTQGSWIKVGLRLLGHIHSHTLWANKKNRLPAERPFLEIHDLNTLIFIRHFSRSNQSLDLASRTRSAFGFTLWDLDNAPDSGWHNVGFFVVHYSPGSATESKIRSLRKRKGADPTPMAMLFCGFLIVDSNYKVVSRKVIDKHRLTAV